MNDMLQLKLHNGTLVDAKQDIITNPKSKMKE
jgi:hypothetical protein